MKIEDYIRTKGACLDFSLEKAAKVFSFMQETILGEKYDPDTMEFGDASFFPATNIFLGKKEIKGVMCYVLYDIQTSKPIYRCGFNNFFTQEIIDELSREIAIPGREKFIEMYYRIQKEMLEQEKPNA